MNDIVNLQQVEKYYEKNGHRIQALSCIDLSVQKGDFALVKGPSGSGKTTLLLSIGGMLQPSSGQVQVSGQNIYNLNDREKVQFRAHNVGFIFQMFHLIPYLHVRENILIHNETSGMKVKESDLLDLTDELGISHRLDHRPSQLSAGEKQRVALARALIKKPTLVLADEPTGNLDGENSQIVLQKLRSFCDEGGTVVMVSHDDYPDQYANKLITIGQKASTVHNP